MNLLEMLCTCERSQTRAFKLEFDLFGADLLHASCQELLPSTQFDEFDGGEQLTDQP